MYARNYSENEKPQTFRRGDYNIPANYHGNVFTADEAPNADATEDVEVCCRTEVRESELCRCDDCPKEKIIESYPLESCPQEINDSKPCETERKKGLFSGILSRFDKGFELDDLLIIGLILILLNGDKSKCPENRDEIIILLALLLLGG